MSAKIYEMTAPLADLEEGNAEEPQVVETEIMQNQDTLSTDSDQSAILSSIPEKKQRKKKQSKKNTLPALLSEVDTTNTTMPTVSAKDLGKLCYPSTAITLNMIWNATNSGELGIIHLLRLAGYNDRVCRDEDNDIWYTLNPTSHLWEKSKSYQYVREVGNILSPLVEWALENTCKITDRDTAGSLAKGIFDIRKTLLQLKTRMEIAKSAAEENGATEGRVSCSVPASIFDNHNGMLVAKNGVLVDFDKRQVRRLECKDYMRVCANTNYVENSKKPVKFLKALRDAFKYPLKRPTREDIEETISEKMPPFDTKYPLERRRFVFESEAIKAKAEREAARKAYDEERNKLIDEVYKTTLEMWERNCATESEEIVGFMQRLLGCSLYGGNREQIMVFFLGAKGGNSKSFLQRIITHVLGDHYARSTRTATFTNKNDDSRSANPALCDLDGPKIVFAAESNSNEAFNQAFCKQFTGGDQLSTRQNYGPEYRFVPKCTPFILSNYLPHAQSHDTAFWRRQIIIHFDMCFVDEPDPNDHYQLKRDNNLENEIKETESEGIMAWLIEGVYEYLDKGLNVPDFVRARTNECKDNRDVIQHFIDDTTEAAPYLKDCVTPKQLFFVYRQWCCENNSAPLSKANLLQYLDRKGHSIGRSANSSRIRGLALNERGALMLDVTMTKHGYSHHAVMKLIEAE